MALIVLTSASGSPGVTTTALALALTWRRPALLVEADPTGGSAVLAGYFRGRAAPTDSLIDLAFAHRGGTSWWRRSRRSRCASRTPAPR